MQIFGYVCLILFVILIVRTIFNPKSKKTGRGLRWWQRLLIGISGVFFGLLALGALLAPNAEKVTNNNQLTQSTNAPAQTQNTNESTTQEANKETQSSTPENSQTAIETSTEQIDYVEARQSIQVGPIWLIQAGWEGQDITFSETLGDEFMGENADGGYTFALVPVAIKNNSKETESLLFATWKLSDNEGYTYETQTMGDIYLSKNQRLDPVDVPPGASRGGYLVFQTRKDVKELFLSVETPRGKGKWRFVVE